MLEILERLATAGIELLPAPEVSTHFIFTRDGFVALVERKGQAFGGIGSAGLLVDQGLAPLVRRGDNAYFVARGFEQQATPEQVETIERFSADLKSALTSSPAA